MYRYQNNRRCPCIAVVLLAGILTLGISACAETHSVPNSVNSPANTEQAPAETMHLEATYMVIMVDAESSLDIVLPERDVDLYEYASSNEEIIRVNAAGDLFPQALGETAITITEKESGRKGYLVVIVKAVMREMTVKQYEVTLHPGEKHLAEVAVKPEEAMPFTKLTYTSSDDTVATVEPTGLVTAHAQGEATITIEAEDGTQRTCIIRVEE